MTHPATHTRVNAHTFTSGLVIGLVLNWRAPPPTHTHSHKHTRINSPHSAAPHSFLYHGQSKPTMWEWWMGYPAPEAHVRNPLPPCPCFTHTFSLDFSQSTVLIPRLSPPSDLISHLPSQSTPPTNAAVCISFIDYVDRFLFLTTVVRTFEPVLAIWKQRFRVKTRFQLEIGDS